MEAGKLVDRSVETCVKACRSASGDGELLKQVAAAAGMVSQALGDLLQHVRHYASCGEPIGRYDQATDTIMNVTENIVTSMGDAGELRGVKNQSPMKNICHQTCSCVRKGPPRRLRQRFGDQRKSPPGIFQRSRLSVMVRET